MSNSVIILSPNAAYLYRQGLTVDIRSDDGNVMAERPSSIKIQISVEEANWATILEIKFPPPQSSL